MSAINNGGPAFPSHGSMGEVTHDGMTLRDYFAAKAMQGVISRGNPFDTERVAKIAYAMADNMLRAREVK